MTKNKQYSKTNKKIVIALGDPAGIGMEITLKALASKDLPQNMEAILVGCQKTLEATYQKLTALGVSQLANPKNFEIKNLPLDKPVNPGIPSSSTGDASFIWLTKATTICLQENIRGLVTAPIAKHAWHEAGHHYPGQTERLAELTNSQDASMLFTAKSSLSNWRLNTLLATTHIPISEVPKELSPDLLYKKIKVLVEFCKKFKENPTIAIAGLNPHAGEKGNIGKEEVQWIIPLLEKFRQENPEIKLIGPMPPDTCWIQAAQAWNGNKALDPPDGILALYHDQGLIPVKLLAFDAAVNTTLGLPFIRTSPDHGTGFDIAGNGSAKSESMVAALNAAWEFTKK